MGQWFHSFGMDDATVRLIVRTFAAVFPRSTIWRLDSGEMLLLGSAEARPDDFAGMAREFGRPRVRADLGRIGVTRLATLLSAQMLSEPAVREAAGAGAVNSDLHPFLEHWAARAVLGRSSTLLQETDERSSPQARGRLALGRYLAARRRPLEARESAELARFNREEQEDAAAP